MQFSVTGLARRFGDDVNTDYIISSQRKRESLDPAVLKNFLFETIAPEFAQTVRIGDILVAGKNFGCGSAMEVAVTAVVGAGIRVVLAQSFARTYFRNAINNGLYPVECDTRAIREGDALQIDIGAHTLVRCASNDQVIEAAPIAHDILKILDAGGLVPYLRRHSSF
ncbi:alpha-IPM isomerase [Paraburkholderia edwinii]|uniref:Alpha-IPM isomerase n=1 Tax=Paraburkholderia edwinii TaxID=2861782 RepID=A0ABX8UQH5_9BURK|nr:alpha-IPM isomerase [Paraburkholderia edwinii]QYD69612.1 alpha-IPM isomerase [Paraburkholderia edwinii]